MESINLADTGLLRRNWHYAETVARLIVHYFRYQARFLDYAGGYGILVRLLRDLGFDFYWMDAHTKNLFARGFEFDSSDPFPVELVTCIECFEHFVNPMDEISKIWRISENLFFTTELYHDVAAVEDWWYLGREHGQHVAFYSEETLRFVAAKLGCNLLTDGRANHLLTNSVADSEHETALGRVKRRLSRVPGLGAAVRRSIARTRRLSFRDVMRGTHVSLQDYGAELKSRTVDDMNLILAGGGRRLDK